MYRTKVAWTHPSHASRRLIAVAFAFVCALSVSVSQAQDRGLRPQRVEAPLAPTLTPPDAAALARETLRTEVRHWVAEQMGQSADSVEIGALDSRVDPSTCGSGYQYDFPFQSRATVRARCSQPPRQFYLRTAVVALTPLLTTARDLPQGHVIQASDLSTRMMKGQPGGVTDPNLAIGRALSRSLAAGETVESRDLDEVITVVRTLAPLNSGDRVSTGSLRQERLARRLAPPGALPAAEANNLSVRRPIPAGQVLTQDDLIDARMVLVARRPLLRGEKLHGSAFEVVERDRRQIPPDHLTSTEGLEHAELIAPIRSGDILRTSQIRRSAVIKKGQLVVLTVNRSGIEIRVKVEALEDARVGEQVKLRNPDSGKALAGVAMGLGSARAL